MSLHFSAPLLFSSPQLPKFPPRIQTSQMKRVIYVQAHSQSNVEATNVVRRSANYKPNIWNYESLMSLTSEYKEDTYREKANELKENVRQLIINSVGTKDILDIIDAAERLGIGHHYENEFRTALDNILLIDSHWFNKDLYTTSLAFRLLRQHGYPIHIDVFDKYVDEDGSLKMCHRKDYKGLLSLYEASYLGFEDEEFMDEVKIFAKQYLRGFQGDTNPTLSKKISHALELPLHWRVSRLESLWYIDTYGSEENMIPMLIDLAKLEYNIVQATNQIEIGILTRWWVDLGIHKMKFFRNRILESFFWTIGPLPKEQHGRCRVGLAQVVQLITLIDDIYDVHGTWEELLLFTKAIERWEVSALEKLPQYMKVVYKALLNLHNEFAYEVIKQQGFNITASQKKVWVDLCNAYLLEAKWHREGYTPTLDEYLTNAVISIGGPTVLTTTYYLLAEKITKESLNCIVNMPSLIYNSSVVVRLADDLGTFTDEMARGDVPKSIQCYMHDAGVSEAVAREHIKYLISEAWKKINKAMLEQYPFSKTFVAIIPNTGRQSQCMYLYGDGHGNPNPKIKDYITSLFVQPIQLGNK